MVRQTPIVINTLGQARAKGYGINVSCLACKHRRDLNMDDLVGDPPPLNSRLSCVECGEKRATTQLHVLGANRSRFAD